MASPDEPNNLLRKVCEKVHVPWALQSIMSWPERPFIVFDRSKEPEQKVVLGMQVHAMDWHVYVDELLVVVVSREVV